jgi:succinate dehydrogenase / fumarate reductase cytochrome b subunit
MERKTVSIATATDLTVPTLGGRYHFLLRRLHSVTGIVLGGYLIVHLLVNATIAQGSSYQVQVNQIHDLPFLPALEWGLIYLPIIYHAIYGIWISLTGQPNVVNYRYGKNWMYLLQRISAAILFFFILFHVLALKYKLFGTNLSFDAHDALRTVARHMQEHKFVAYGVYPIGILASCFHLANGFWAAAITWGLTVSAGAQRRWGVVCLIVFIVTFGAGIAALMAAMAQTV